MVPAGFQRGFRGAVFVTGAVGIAYQIALMRIFSITHWHHFAYMIISIAMLGFGAGGTLLTLAGKRLKGREFRYFIRCSVLLALSMVVCHETAMGVPFETFHVLTERVQILHLFTLYVLLALPFFFVSCMVSLGFAMHPLRVGRVYFLNLTGSGTGAVAVVGLLFLVPPHLLPYILSLPVALVSLLLIKGLPKVERFASVALFLAAAVAVIIRGPFPEEVSQYKPLAYAMDLPDAVVRANTQSPLSRITALSSSMLRETPGQLSNYPMGELGDLPEQTGLFFDGGAVSVINRFRGDLSGFAWLDHVSSALGYRLTENPSVLVIGSGGGTDVLMALYHKADHVTAVEVDPGVFPLMNGVFREFSGGLYTRDDVTPVLAHGRGYLQSTENRFHMIQIALLDSFNAAAAGVYALSESYLYTTEAMELCLERLAPGGVLSVTRWVKTPPRDAVRMFAVMARALENRGAESPGDHMAMIRSWNTATIIASSSPLTGTGVDSIRAFAERRGFDLCWYPGISPEETNRFVLLDRPYYYEAASAILGGNSEGFYRGYPFDVSPPTDDKPYFFQFFRWKTLGRLTGEIDLRWIPLMEWGYLILVLTIAQSAIASVVFILLPLNVLKRGGSPGKKWVVLYFSCLGLGFMFLEMGFIQKFMLFLSYPVYAVAVVLTGLLVFSGLGSLAADRHRGSATGRVKMAVAGLTAVVVIYLFMLPVVFRACAGWPDPGKIALGLVLLFPPAFLMGIPFPSGMGLLGKHSGELIPWAWGINGFAGVMGASLATFTAVHMGFRFLMLLAAAVYIAAALCLAGLARRGRSPGP